MFTRGGRAGCVDARYRRTFPQLHPGFGSED
jgi:hypothetical protein